MKKALFIILLIGIQLFAQHKTTETGLSLIKDFEGLSLKAYQCPAGILTIGYGHTGPELKKGSYINKTQADALLIADCVRFEKYINKTIVRLLRWYEFDALVSFTFNTGFRLKGQLKQSIDEGNTKTAVYLLMRFNKAGAQILSGLTKRRKAETILYEKGLYNAKH